ncbi:MAG: hypothetical protein QXF24_00325 [Thermoproteota archaeon]
MAFSLPAASVCVFSPPLGLALWVSSLFLLYRFLSSSQSRKNAAIAAEVGKHLSGAAAELAFSLAVTGSEVLGAEALAKGEYSLISDLAKESLLKSMDGADVRSSLAASLRSRRGVPTDYMVELLLSPNASLLDAEHLLEQTEQFARRNFSEFTRRLDALLPAYFFAAFFLPFSALILSALLGGFVPHFLAAFFPLFSLVMWAISKALFRAAVNVL